MIIIQYGNDKEVKEGILNTTIFKSADYGKVIEAILENKNSNN